MAARDRRADELVEHTTLAAVSQFVPLAVLVLLGLLFYWSGRGTRAQQADLPIGPDAVAPVVSRS